jgi:hypothetical protein
MSGAHARVMDDAPAMTAGAPRILEVPEIVKRWRELEPHLKRVCGRRLAWPDMVAVMDRLARGDWQLWGAERDGELVAVLCTGIGAERDGSKTLRFELLAGDGIDWRQRTEDIIEWGRRQGCARARIAGRRGFRRVFHDWTLMSVTLERAI